MLSKTMAILLGIIHQQPVNAYELTKWLSQLNVGSWYNIPDSTVYATIRTAEKKGYIHGRVEKDGNMPDKTVFTITETGYKKFIDTIEKFICDIEYDITPFSIAMFFVKALDKDKAISLMEQRILTLEKYLQEIDKQIELLKEQNIPNIIIGNTLQNLYIIEAQLKGANMLLPQVKEL